MPIVDPVTKAYRPGTRALDYRSEPFSNRLALQARERRPARRIGRLQLVCLRRPGHADAPELPSATPSRSVSSTRARRSRTSPTSTAARCAGDAIPAAEPGDFASGIDKHPPLVPVASERTDSQALGPVRDVRHRARVRLGRLPGIGRRLPVSLPHRAALLRRACGGCGASTTRSRTASASTDELPPLRPLPDRVGAVVPAVTSDALVGATVDPGTGRRRRHRQPHCARWSRDSCRRRGVPADDDASVMDWSVDGSRYLGEPETDRLWPGYTSSAPGQPAGPPVRSADRPPRVSIPAPAPGQAPAVRAAAWPGAVPGPTRRTPRATGARARAGRPRCARRARSPGTWASSRYRCPCLSTRRRTWSIRRVSCSCCATRSRASSRDPAARVPLVIRANAGEDCIDAHADQPARRPVRQQPPSARSACTSTSSSSTCRAAMASMPASTTSRRCRPFTLGGPHAGAAGRSRQHEPDAGSAPRPIRGSLQAGRAGRCRASTPPTASRRARSRPSHGDELVLRRSAGRARTRRADRQHRVRALPLVSRRAGGHLLLPRPRQRAARRGVTGCSGRSSSSRPGPRYHDPLRRRAHRQRPRGRHPHPRRWCRAGRLGQLPGARPVRHRRHRHQPRRDARPGSAIDLRAEPLDGRGGRPRGTAQQHRARRSGHAGVRGVRRRPAGRADPGVGDQRHPDAAPRRPPVPHSSRGAAARRR